MQNNIRQVSHQPYQSACLQGIRRVLKLLTGLIVVISLNITPCFAQEIPANLEQIVALSQPKTEVPNLQQLESFIDTFFAYNMASFHVPGATIALVKEDKVLTAKGYGFADMEKQIPVSPDKTLFHVGAISKLFTATAIMQLSEQRRLNLNDDVNNYLQGFQLEKTYPQPVTFANLLTHTAGFDERNIGTAARKISEVVSLEQYLKQRMPPRVLPPGKAIHYSDHGIALAGYLVEIISGLPFAQYINDNILHPLGMYHSSFLQPLPQHLETDMAKGYEYKNSTYQKVSLDYFNLSPAEALNTTASDIARFMIAHLQDGRYGSSRILNDATAQEMHKQHFSYHPRLPGYAYGFYERFYNNQRTLVHIGNWHGFSSYLVLIPDQKLGLFIANNSSGLSSKFNNLLIQRFFNRYYPVPHPSANHQIKTISQEQNQFTGSYRYKRYSRRSLEKLNTLITQSQVKISQEGSLILDGSLLMQIEPLLFKIVDDGDYVAFQKDKNGRITKMFISDFEFEKLSWYEVTLFQASIFAVFLLIFLYGCSSWFISNLNLFFMKSVLRTGRINRRARFMTGLVSTLNLIFIIAIALSLLLMNEWELTYGLPFKLVALLCIPLLSLSVTIGLPILILRACQNKYWSIRQKLHYSLLTITAVAFLPFLNYWNLLGFRF